MPGPPDEWNRVLQAAPDWAPLSNRLAVQRVPWMAQGCPHPSLLPATAATPAPRLPSLPRPGPLHSHPAPTTPASSEFLPSTLGPPLPAHPLPISGPSLLPHFPLPSVLGAPHLWPPRTPSFLFLPLDTVPPRPSLGAAPTPSSLGSAPQTLHQAPTDQGSLPWEPQAPHCVPPGQGPPPAAGLVRSPRAQPGPGAPHSRL